MEPLQLIASVDRDLALFATEYRLIQKIDEQATIRYCQKLTKLAQTVSDKAKSQYELYLLLLCKIMDQLRQIYNTLAPTMARLEMCQQLFVLCTKAILGIQWKQLADDNPGKQGLQIVLEATHTMLSAAGYTRIQLLLDLMATHWDDPTLFKIINNQCEEGEEEEVKAYILKQDPMVLKLRVEVLLEEDLEDFVIHLCHWCATHPMLKDDIYVRQTQLILLHKHNMVNSFREECQKISCHFGVQIVTSLRQMDQHKKVCVLLSQTFLIQDWINPNTYCCTNELLKLWIQHQYVADKDYDKFSDSVWSIAKLSRKTIQLGYLIEALKTECGRTQFLQLLTDLAIYALNLDKGILDCAKSLGDHSAIVLSEKAIAKTCVLIHNLYQGSNLQVQQRSILTAFALDPTPGHFTDLVKIYEQKHHLAQNAAKKDSTKTDSSKLDSKSTINVDSLKEALPHTSHSVESKASSSSSSSHSPLIITGDTKMQMKVDMGCARILEKGDEDSGTINPATLYEMDRLLKLFRPWFFDPLLQWKELYIVARDYIAHNKSISPEVEAKIRKTIKSIADEQDKTVDTVQTEQGTVGRDQFLKHALELQKAAFKKKGRGRPRVKTSEKPDTDNKEVQKSNNSLSKMYKMVYKCLICSSIFEEVQKLKEHVRTVCKPDGPEPEKITETSESSSKQPTSCPVYMCRLCKDVKTSLQGFEFHLATKHAAECDGTGGNIKICHLYRCKYCKIFFAKRDDLHSHLNVCPVKIQKIARGEIAAKSSGDSPESVSSNQSPNNEFIHVGKANIPPKQSDDSTSLASKKRGRKKKLEMTAIKDKLEPKESNSTGSENEMNNPKRRGKRRKDDIDVDTARKEGRKLFPRRVKDEAKEISATRDLIERLLTGDEDLTDDLSDSQSSTSIPKVKSKNNNDCELCDNKFANRNVLIQHYAVSHIKPYKFFNDKAKYAFKCFYCNVCFQTFMKYVDHLNEHEHLLMESVAKMKQTGQVSKDSRKKVIDDSDSDSSEDLVKPTSNLAITLEESSGSSTEIETEDSLADIPIKPVTLETNLSNMSFLEDDSSEDSLQHLVEQQPYTKLLNENSSMQSTPESANPTKVCSKDSVQFSSFSKMNNASQPKVDKAFHPQLHSVVQQQMTIVSTSQSTSVSIPDLANVSNQQVDNASTPQLSNVSKPKSALNSQLVDVSNSQLSKDTNSQLNNIENPQEEQVSTSQLNNVPTSELTKVTNLQLSCVTNIQVDDVSNHPVANVSSVQYDNETNPELATDGNAQVCNISDGTLTNVSKSQMDNVLTPQLSHVSNPQHNVFKPQVDYSNQLTENVSHLQLDNVLHTQVDNVVHPKVLFDSNQQCENSSNLQADNVSNPELGIVSQPQSDIIADICQDNTDTDSHYEVQSVIEATKTTEESSLSSSEECSEYEPSTRPSSCSDISTMNSAVESATEAIVQVESIDEEFLQFRTAPEELQDLFENSTNDSDSESFLDGQSSMDSVDESYIVAGDKTPDLMEDVASPVSALNSFEHSTSKDSKVLKVTSDVDVKLDDPVGATKTQPVAKTTQPMTTTTQPMTSTTTTQPMTSTTQPMKSTTQPMTSTTQPMTSTTQLMTIITQPMTTTTQPQSNQSLDVLENRRRSFVDEFASIISLSGNGAAAKKKSIKKAKEALSKPELPLPDCGHEANLTLSGEEMNVTALCPHCGQLVPADASMFHPDSPMKKASSDWGKVLTKQLSVKISAEDRARCVLATEKLHSLSINTLPSKPSTSVQEIKIPPKPASEKLDNKTENPVKVEKDRITTCLASQQPKKVLRRNSRGLSIDTYKSHQLEHVPKRRNSTKGKPATPATTEVIIDTVDISGICELFATYDHVENQDSVDTIESHKNNPIQQDKSTISKPPTDSGNENIKHNEERNIKDLDNANNSKISSGKNSEVLDESVLNTTKESKNDHEELNPDGGSRYLSPRKPILERNIFEDLEEGEVRLSEKNSPDILNDGKSTSEADTSHKTVTDQTALSDTALKLSHPLLIPVVTLKRIKNPIVSVKDIQQHEKSNDAFNPFVEDDKQPLVTICNEQSPSPIVPENGKDSNNVTTKFYSGKTSLSKLPEVKVCMESLKACGSLNIAPERENIDTSNQYTAIGKEVLKTSVLHSASEEKGIEARNLLHSKTREEDIKDSLHTKRVNKESETSLPLQSETSANEVKNSNLLLNEAVEKEIQPCNSIQSREEESKPLRQTFSFGQTPAPDITTVAPLQTTDGTNLEVEDSNQVNIKEPTDDPPFELDNVSHTNPETPTGDESKETSKPSKFSTMDDSQFEPMVVTPQAESVLLFPIEKLARNEQDATAIPYIADSVKTPAPNASSSESSEPAPNASSSESREPAPNASSCESSEPAPNASSSESSEPAPNASSSESSKPAPNASSSESSEPAPNASSSESSEPAPNASSSESSDPAPNASSCESSEPAPNASSSESSEPAPNASSCESSEPAPNASSCESIEPAPNASSSESSDPAPNASSSESSDPAPNASSSESSEPAPNASSCESSELAPNASSSESSEPIALELHSANRSKANVTEPNNASYKSINTVKIFTMDNLVEAKQPVPLENPDTDGIFLDYSSKPSTASATTLLAKSSNSILQSCSNQEIQSEVCAEDSCSTVKQGFSQDSRSPNVMPIISVMDKSVESTSSQLDPVCLSHKELEAQIPNPTKSEIVEPCMSTDISELTLPTVSSQGIISRCEPTGKSSELISHDIPETTPVSVNFPNPSGIPSNCSQSPEMLLKQENVSSTQSLSSVHTSTFSEEFGLAFPAAAIPPLSSDIPQNVSTVKSRQEDAEVTSPMACHPIESCPRVTEVQPSISEQEISAETTANVTTNLFLQTTAMDELPPVVSVKKDQTILTASECAETESPENIASHDGTNKAASQETLGIVDQLKNPSEASVLRHSKENSTKTVEFDATTSSQNNKSLFNPLIEANSLQSNEPIISSASNISGTQDLNIFSSPAVKKIALLPKLSIDEGLPHVDSSNPLKVNMDESVVSKTDNLQLKDSSSQSTEQEYFIPESPLQEEGIACHTETNTPSIPSLSDQTNPAEPTQNSILSTYTAVQTAVEEKLILRTSTTQFKTPLDISTDSLDKTNVSSPTTEATSSVSSAKGLDNTEPLPGDGDVYQQAPEIPKLSNKNEVLSQSFGTRDLIQITLEDSQSDIPNSSSPLPKSEDQGRKKMSVQSSTHWDFSTEAKLSVHQEPIASTSPQPSEPVQINTSPSCRLVNQHEPSPTAEPHLHNDISQALSSFNESVPQTNSTRNNQFQLKDTVECSILPTNEVETAIVQEEKMPLINSSQWVACSIEVSTDVIPEADSLMAKANCIQDNVCGETTDITLDTSTNECVVDSLDDLIPPEEQTKSASAPDLLTDIMPETKDVPYIVKNNADQLSKTDSQSSVVTKSENNGSKQSIEKCEIEENRIEPLHMEDHVSHQKSSKDLDQRDISEQTDLQANVNSLSIQSDSFASTALSCQSARPVTRDESKNPIITDEGVLTDLTVENKSSLTSVKPLYPQSNFIEKAKSEHVNIDIEKDSSNKQESEVIAIPAQIETEVQSVNNVKTLCDPIHGAASSTGEKTEVNRISTTLKNKREQNRPDRRQRSPCIASRPKRKRTRTCTDDNYIYSYPVKHQKPKQPKVQDVVADAKVKRERGRSSTRLSITPKSASSPAQGGKMHSKLKHSASESDLKSENLPSDIARQDARRTQLVSVSQETPKPATGQKAPVSRKMLRSGKTVQKDSSDRLPHDQKLSSIEQSIKKEICPVTQKVRGVRTHEVSNSDDTIKVEHATRKSCIGKKNKSCDNQTVEKMDTDNNDMDSQSFKQEIVNTEKSASGQSSKNIEKGQDQTRTSDLLNKELGQPTHDQFTRSNDSEEVKSQQRQQTHKPLCGKEEINSYETSHATSDEVTTTTNKVCKSLRSGRRIQSGSADETCEKSGSRELFTEKLDSSDSIQNDERKISDTLSNKPISAEQKLETSDEKSVSHDQIRSIENQQHNTSNRVEVNETDQQCSTSDKEKYQIQEVCNKDEVVTNKLETAKSSCSEEVHKVSENLLDNKTKLDQTEQETSTHSELDSTSAQASNSTLFESRSKAIPVIKVLRSGRSIQVSSNEFSQNTESFTSSMEDQKSAKGIQSEYYNIDETNNSIIKPKNISTNSDDDGGKSSSENLAQDQDVSGKMGEVKGERIRQPSTSDRKIDLLEDSYKKGEEASNPPQSDDQLTCHSPPQSDDQLTCHNPPHSDDQLSNHISSCLQNKDKLEQTPTKPEKVEKVSPEVTISASVETRSKTIRGCKVLRSGKSIQVLSDDYDEKSDKIERRKVEQNEGVETDQTINVINILEPACSTSDEQKTKALSAENQDKAKETIEHHKKTVKDQNSTKEGTEKAQVTKVKSEIVNEPETEDWQETRNRLQNNSKPKMDTPKLKNNKSMAISKCSSVDSSESIICRKTLRSGRKLMSIEDTAEKVDELEEASVTEESIGEKGDFPPMKHLDQEQTADQQETDQVIAALEKEEESNTSTALSDQSVLADQHSKSKSTVERSAVQKYSGCTDVDIDQTTDMMKTSLQTEIKTIGVKRLRMSTLPCPTENINKAAKQEKELKANKSKEVEVPPAIEQLSKKQKLEIDETQTDLNSQTSKEPLQTSQDNSMTEILIESKPKLGRRRNTSSDEPTIGEGNIYRVQLCSGTQTSSDKYKGISSLVHKSKLIKRESPAEIDPVRKANFVRMGRTMSLKSRLLPKSSKPFTWDMDDNGDHINSDNPKRSTESEPSDEPTLLTLRKSLRSKNFEPIHRDKNFEVLKRGGVHKTSKSSGATHEAGFNLKSTVFEVVNKTASRRAQSYQKPGEISKTDGKSVGEVHLLSPGRRNSPVSWDVTSNDSKTKPAEFVAVKRKIETGTNTVITPVSKYPRILTGKSKSINEPTTTSISNPVQPTRQTVHIVTPGRRRLIHTTRQSPRTQIFMTFPGGVDSSIPDQSQSMQNIQKSAGIQQPCVVTYRTVDKIPGDHLPLSSRSQPKSPVSASVELTKGDQSSIPPIFIRQQGSSPPSLANRNTKSPSVLPPQEDCANSDSGSSNGDPLISGQKWKLQRQRNKRGYSLSFTKAQIH